MADVCVRRYASPKIARSIHAAIQKISDQKQCPTFERLQKAVVVDGVKIPPGEVENQVRLAIRDGLVVEAKTTSNHGKTKGAIQTAYRIVTNQKFIEQNKDDDPHDWYCWECHREGEVVLCSSCIRVYHKKCAQLSVADLQGKFVCPVCKEIESKSGTSAKELEDVQTMLTFVLTRMKEKADEVWLPLPPEKYPTFRAFVKEDVCLKTLGEKIENGKFGSFLQFRSDVIRLRHNFIVYFGAAHAMVGSADRALIDADHELEQITICSDCYMMSNKRPTHWFSIPCKKTHALCYAKLGTDPPWPAKILQISEDGTSYDVRFFGPPHQRAWISSRNVSSLDWKPVVKKRTKTWIEAEKELEEHLRLLGNIKANEQKQVQQQQQQQQQPETPAEEPSAECSIKSEKKTPKKPRPAPKRVVTNGTGSSPPLKKPISSNNNKNGFVSGDYQLVEGLQATLKEMRKAIENAKMELLDEKEKFAEQANQIEVLRQEKEEIKRQANESVSETKNEFDIFKTQFTQEKEQLEQRVNDLQQRLELQATEYENQRLADSKQWEQKLRGTEEEFSRHVALAKQEADLKASGAVDEAVRKVKIEADSLSKQYVLENMRRAQIETERLLCDTVAATKKKSWCANCSSEAFYHCCWNTNYCSTDCQRVHWMTHRYQCTRDIMNTCRSCQQQRQVTFPINPFPHHVPQK